MKFLRALLLGGIFGVGLLVSGMTDPARVKAFLDWTGDWDASLAFVMGAAVFTATPFFLAARAERRPIVAEQFDIPESSRIDAPLVVGAALFGIGWGITGICPGPGFVLLGLDFAPALFFVLPMLAALWLSARLPFGARSAAVQSDAEQAGVSA